MKFPIPLPFTIYVTQSDINKGCQNHTKNCPTAHAINRRLPKGFFSFVWYDRIEIFTKDKHGDYKLTHEIKNPPRLNKWLKSYDKEKKVRPLRFPITINDITRKP